jgi:hypothetical protein
MGIDLRRMVLCRFGRVGVLFAEGNFSYIDSDMKDASMAGSSGLSKSSSSFVAIANASASSS